MSPIFNTQETDSGIQCESRVSKDKQVASLMEEYNFVLTETVNKEYRDSIDSKLMEYNIAQSDYFLEVRKPERGRKPLDIFLCDREGSIVGGITALMLWDWLHIERLYLDSKLRRKGYGKQLISQLEGAAKQKGCDHAQVRTFSFQARGFYEKLGYQVVGTLDDYPDGYTLYWLRKDLQD